MPKYSTNYLFLLLTLAFSTPTFADVYKWKDANGKTHYGDAPPIAGTEKVRTDKQTDDQIANGERIRGEMGGSSQSATRDPKCEELLTELKNTPMDPSTQSLGELYTAKVKRSAITQEYELRCMSASDRQAKQEKRVRNREMQKQQTGILSTVKASCISDFECGIGNRCVKAPLQSTGACMKSVNEYGVQEYKMPRTESVMPNMNINGQCSFDTDCPIGFRCDSKYKACIK